MIADLKNLGSPMGGFSGLGSQSKVDRLAKTKSTGDTELQGTNGTDSFERTLNDKMQPMKASTMSKAPGKELSQPGKAPEIQKNRTGQSKADDLETVERKPSEKSENSEASESAPATRVAKKNTKSHSAGDAGTREQVMLGFMDSMESEFGIPPTRIVEAMTNLSDQDMLRSPEETASQVISQLDLKPEEQEKAMSLYMGMIAQLQSQELGPKAEAIDVRQQTPKMEAMGNLAAAPALMNSRERRSQLNQSLDKMNQQFFMRTPPVKAPTEEGDGISAGKADKMALLNAEMPDRFSLAEDLGSNRDLMPKDALGLPRDAESSGGKPIASPPSDMRMSVEDIDDSPDYRPLAKSLAALNASAASLNESLKSDPQNAQALRAEQAMNQMRQNQAQPPNMDNTMAGGAAMMGLAAMTGQQAGTGDQEFNSSGKDQGTKDFLTKTAATGKNAKAMASASEFFVSNQAPIPSSSAPTVTSATDSASQLAGTGAVTAGALKDTEGSKENKASIQQVMNQAQYLIRKGGGESRIQMNPEGLGQLHLKVAVNEGKVNVEMAAETKEAKKLLESSVSDLKSQLHSQHLKLENIKVDVGQNFGNDKSQSDNSQQQAQRQHDLRQDMEQRQQTRQFFEQFRDEGRREGFIDSPGLKAYSSNKGPAPLQPAETASASKRKAGSGKGSGLDLVA